MRIGKTLPVSICSLALTLASIQDLPAQRTHKPVLHGRHWVAITGKPLGATAGAMMFARGGNAVDAACAMLAATATMWDVLGWGGETQALIYNPETGKVIGINALGVAPSGATAEFFKEKGLRYPPDLGPLAAVTPGTPGGLLTMLAEWGSLSLAEVLEPAIEMAEGYPIEEQTADAIERNKERIKEWKYSREVYLTHPGEEREAPYPGEIFRQPDLAETLRKLVEAERHALAGGATREEAIYAAYDRFYTGDIAEELVRGAREEGALLTMADLADWQVYVEEPVMTTYRDIEVYKLTTWVQGPVLLQLLNILENFDLAAMGYNSARYIHTLYQAMNLAFADRDFYYGDPYYPPDEPIEGLLSKQYGGQRAATIDPERNDPNAGPGNPYPFQGDTNPYLHYIEDWQTEWPPREAATSEAMNSLEQTFSLGTTSIQAADEDGWVVSVTPSGAWIPAVIAGQTGVGLSQRAQSFVLYESENPFNVIEPGKRPRATLTPTITLKDGRPFVSVAVQGGDSQDQNTLQFLLNMILFGMDVQEAVEAANFNSYQMRGSFRNHPSRPGSLLLNEAVPVWVRAELRTMGYDLFFRDRTSGPLNAIYFDWEHGSFWGGSSDHGEDYGIAW
ncbi:MAG: gamma-glutamyltransferase family protein [Gemmatimonadetes bacterium]|uniref:Gamma-glutamyltransferase family protein n=1 Tax=Candidatus Kutchimonas denitrificans TaxID=3056748 RepID=A0AAE5CD07_9BACT|nr:gamma-glutamyltransferase family protein [Gemmatimonadota bacterium]NIR76380.1 gamma-glutamyltransferase family protein [Candidatus Kutchimonas denitrificans]NIS03190.1 gamma-glutamyltransferase family protein [Gemmatimonadota bacterium]NIT66363.1 gamma-glutamyltransferase family protein [Gemmatimonadota bacterium]NIU54442.1 gamma-glutamyltransferase family protein [Gemmatimonadota bacterium]